MLFKWDEQPSAGPISIIPWDRSLTHAVDYWGRLGYELGRCGLTEAALSDEHRKTFADLEGYFQCGIHRELSYLYDWRYLDMDAIRERSHAPANKMFLKKPRIDITMDITSYGNFRLQWRPSTKYSVNGEKCDFDYWPGDTGYFERPKNELMFVRGMDGLSLRSSYVNGAYDYAAVSALLLFALRASVKELVRSLELNFEVNVKDAFEFEFEKDSTNPSNSGTVINWRLYNIEERARENAARWRDAFEQNYGCTLPQFLGLFEHYPYTRQDASLTPEQRYEMLRWQGKETMRKNDVSRVYHMIQDYLSRGFLGHVAPELPPEFCPPKRRGRKPRR